MTESVYNKRESRPGTRKIDRTRLKRNHDKPGQRYRFLIQSAFSLLCLWLGVEFYFFIRYLETNGASGWTYRPPGVEGFLPISSLMSLYHFFISGEIHPAHPAGLVILIAILIVSVVFGKAFCSWLCPVGFISELLGHISRVVFKRNLKLPGILDYPLRGFKYLLLGFFIYSIFFLMTPPALETFLGSPYNLVADIKMYYFFAEISQTALLVIGGLLLLSLIFRNFWCRYLCPYGALLGILALLSPNRIKRNAPNCIDCGRCARVCPSFIKVDKVKTVISDECTTCLQCVEVCPVKETLEYRSLLTRRSFPVIKVALGVVLLFIVITGMGMVTGLWQNNITTDEYLHHQKYLKSYSHPTGTGEIMDYNQRAGSGEAKSKPWEKETDNE